MKQGPHVADDSAAADLVSNPVGTGLPHRNNVSSVAAHNGIMVIRLPVGSHQATDINFGRLAFHLHS